MIKMIDIKIKGMDKVERKLKRLQNNVENIDGEMITATNKEEAIKKVKKKIFKGV